MSSEGTARCWLVLIAACAVLGQDFSLPDYGGVGDGHTLNTVAFEKAVAAIAAAGSGRLVVPAGQWLTAPFNLTSNSVLFLAENATILGVQDFSLHAIIPPLPSYGQGRDHPGPRRTSLIHGEHLINVTVTGQTDAAGNPSAMIDGQGDVWWEAHRNKTEAFTRGSLVEFLYSRDITLTNLQLHNSPFWTVHPYDCDNVVVRNLIIRAPADSPNTDGVDPDSSRNVIIEDVDYYGGDDGIAIKSGWDCFGIAYGKASANIFIRNMTVGPHNCIAIGSEMSGGVENVTVRDIRCLQNAYGLYIKTSDTRGGYVRQVAFQDCVLGSMDTCLYIQDDYHAANPACQEHKIIPSMVTDIEWDNIQQAPGTKCKTAGKFVGLDSSHEVTNLKLTHVHLEGGDFECHHAAGVSEDVSPPTCLGPSLARI